MLNVTLVKCVAGETDTGMAKCANRRARCEAYYREIAGAAAKIAHQNGGWRPQPAGETPPCPLRLECDGYIGKPRLAEGFAQTRLAERVISEFACNVKRRPKMRVSTKLRCAR